MCGPILRDSCLRLVTEHLHDKCLSPSLQVWEGLSHISLIQVFFEIHYRELKTIIEKCIHLQILESILPKIAPDFLQEIPSF